MNTVLASIKKQIYYDADSGVFTWLVIKTGVSRVGQRAGCLSNGCRIITVDRKRYYAAVLAWFIKKGRLPTKEIDHHNRIKDDDRWVNLRPATHLQNMWNKEVYSNNKLKMRGVRKHLSTGKYEARLSVRKKPIYLGLFETPEEACAAYENAAKKHFGKFAAKTYRS